MKPTVDFLAELRADRHIDATLCGQHFDFLTTWGLFSPKEIDEGTRLLLDHMEVQENDDCLDLGCGYGPIGLTLAKLAPNGQTLMIDNNFVAVEYANRNVAHNHIPNAEARMSHGFRDIAGRRFDLIASNLPAKVGKEMWYLYLYDALASMNPGGRIYLVTINGLRDFVKRAFNEVFGNYDKVKQGKTYTVALAYKPDA
ncbi:MAG: methyltransferase [Gammaproteobacteria bacterium]|nr:methyltransferase [Gammaproteobacteria bacterium]MCP5135770.1 methyltransferase [Gammaproteobacteria bacterium]